MRRRTIVVFIPKQIHFTSLAPPQLSFHGFPRLLTLTPLWWIEVVRFRILPASSLGWGDNIGQKLWMAVGPDGELVAPALVASEGRRGWVKETAVVLRNEDVSS